MEESFKQFNKYIKAEDCMGLLEILNNDIEEEEE